MNKNRLEAFSDGVIAIIITVMVLQIPIPKTGDLRALGEVAPSLMAYVMSFVYVGIYWNNHHHMVHTLKKVTGGILWANLHLLFWLSLAPFATAWMGNTHFAQMPCALYGVVLFMASMAYLTLQLLIIRTQGDASELQRAIGSDVKGKISSIAYALGIGLSWVNPWISLGIYWLIAIVWIVPDRRIERNLHHSSTS